MADKRTTFDELCELYTEWRDRISNYKYDSAKLVWHLAKEFRHYISAPETIDEFGKRYTYALKVNRDAEGEIHYDEPEYSTDVLNLDEDGYWSSAIVVVLDDVYAKTDFKFEIRFVLRGRQCELHIGKEKDGKFEFNVDAAESRKPAYEYMVRLLKETFKREPWSIPSKAPIGFRQPSPPKEPIED
jgi:hypothetical protein